MILGYTDEDLTDDVHSELCREYLHPVYTTQPVVKQLYNRFDSWLYRVNKRTTGCQTGCQTGLTTGLMFVYTIQPVVKPV